MKTCWLALALVACGGGGAHHEDRDDPATAAPTLALSVDVAGQAVAWNADDFGRTPHHAGANHQGDARDVWSLRDLVHTLVGPTARVVEVDGGGASAMIPPDAWDDPARTPILHTTRRGALKFRWENPDGSWQEAAVKDVAKLEIVR